MKNMFKIEEQAIYVNRYIFRCCINLIGHAACIKGLAQVENGLFHYADVLPDNKSSIVTNNNIIDAKQIACYLYCDVVDV